MCTGVIGRKKEKEEKWPVLTNDSFEMNTTLLSALLDPKRQEVLIAFGSIPPGEHIISKPGLL